MTHAVYDLIVAGGGAAGFFGAITAAENNPGLSVLILEKSTKLLSKVKVSGGGRCNVTHNCFEATPLSRHYPRGQKELKQMFRRFQAVDMIAWLKGKGVSLKAEEDGRMFPVTDNSQTIIDCFMREARRHQFRILTQCTVTAIERRDNAFVVQTREGEKFSGRNILVATGGNNSVTAYDWIAKMGHAIVNPVPSLFTFNDTGRSFQDLMGVSVPDAEVKIASTKYSQRGPLLITHWGLSGPAVLRLSAWAAEYLRDQNYSFTTLVNWSADTTEESLRIAFDEIKKEHPRQTVSANPLFRLPGRLWKRLCELAGVPETRVWGELSQKASNRLIEFIIRCPFVIRGKTTFKEEFVTCGGVDLATINTETMESKVTPGLYFAGEVMNIDGETGGFNFQAAWTTGYLAGNSIAGNCKQKNS